MVDSVYFYVSLNYGFLSNINQFESPSGQAVFEIRKTHNSFVHGSVKVRTEGRSSADRTMLFCIPIVCLHDIIQ